MWIINGMTDLENACNNEYWYDDKLPIGFFAARVFISENNLQWGFDFDDHKEEIYQLMLTFEKTEQNWNEGSTTVYFQKFVVKVGGILDCDFSYQHRPICSVCGAELMEFEEIDLTTVIGNGSVGELTWQASEKLLEWLDKQGYQASVENDSNPEKPDSYCQSNMEHMIVWRIRPKNDDE